MNRNRNNNSQRGNYGMGSGLVFRNDNFNNFGGRGRPMMDFEPDMPGDFSEDFDFDSNRGRGPMRSSMNMGGKTPEMIAFDNEFKKWQKSFDDWKLVNQSHPNREEYRYYEQKFLDVRKKLMEKRLQIYGSSSRSRSNEPVFENQLCAADAMAQSILSKFGNEGSSGNRSNSNNRRDYNRRNNFNGPSNDYNDMNMGGGMPMGRNMPMGMGYGRNMGGNMGGGMDGQIINEIARLGSNPSNRWILNALSRALSNPEPQPLMGNRRFPPQNMGNSRNFGNFRNQGNARNARNRSPKKGDQGRDDKSKTSGAAKRLKRNLKHGKQPSDRAPTDRENDPVKAAEIFYARLDQIYEDARNSECPKFLPGSATKRIRLIKAKKPEEVEEREKKLLELMEFIHAKRKAFYDKRDKELAEAKLLEGDGTEEEAKVVVNMDEDVLMADDTPAPVPPPTETTATS